MSAGTFIMIDGIDGSGKSSVVEAWKKYFTDHGNAIFDLKNFLKENNRYPDYNELTMYDFIFSAEPTYTGVGKVIRDELIKNGTSYPDQAIAEAYSLDRLIMYTKIIIPALADGKCVIQDRGVSTSLCYQSLGGKLSFADIAELPGNALALEHRPDHLVLMRVAAEAALSRIGSRLDKQDDVIFEHQEFLKNSAACFASAGYQKLFSSRGSQVHELSGEPELAILLPTSIQLLTSFFQS